MQLQTTENKGFEILQLTGPLDIEAVEHARESFKALTERVKKGLVVDMSGVTFMDSSGVGALVFMYKRLTAEHRTLHLVGLNNQPLKLVQLLRINRTIPTHTSIQDFMALPAILAD